MYQTIEGSKIYWPRLAIMRQWHFQVAFSELEKGGRVCKRRLILLKARLPDIFDWLFIEKFFCVSLMSRSFLCNWLHYLSATTPKAKASSSAVSWQERIILLSMNQGKHYCFRKANIEPSRSRSFPRTWRSVGVQIFIPFMASAL